jgi:uroporphyrinogen decarboxylase
MTQALTGRARMLAACRGEPTDRAPVWLMRQAGRYLPEYREIQQRTGFLERCRDPGLAAELSLQPQRRFGVDGVVVFSDILLPLAGAGLELEFDPGPVIGNPIRGARDVEKLAQARADAVEPTCEAIRQLRAELGNRAAVIGFAGAPFTLAAYALEERLSRDLGAISALSYREPALLERLLSAMAGLAADALRRQIAAGADVVQIFDTWAGQLDARRFARFAGPALAQVLAQLPRERPPVIVFARGAAHLTDALAGLGADVVSLDWRVDLGAAARGIGRRVALQGNLDPAALFAPPDEIARQVRELRAAGRAARGHVLNLGHGVQLGTPVEGVAAFVAAAREPGSPDEPASGPPEG